MKYLTVILLAATSFTAYWLEPIPNQTVKEGQSLSFVVKPHSSDSNEVFLYQDKVYDFGGKFESGRFSWTPDFNQAGNRAVPLKIMRGETIEANQVVNITVVNVNRLPVFVSIPAQTVKKGQLLQFAVIANDADGDVLKYSASGMPSGATFYQGVFSWTPKSTNWLFHTYSVTFTVKDPSKVAVKKVVKITVIK